MINLGGQAVLGANAFTATQQIFAASGTSPDFEVWLNGDTVGRVALGLNSADGARMSFGPGSGSRDVFMERATAANLRFGGPDAASPVAQTLSIQNVLAGTSNAAGASMIVAGSRGTGTGAGGSIVFQTAPAGLTGSTQNALATALTLDSTLAATLATTGKLLWSSQGGMSSPSDGFITLLNNAGTSFTRLQFGGVSSSNPAISRATSSALSIGLADGSNWASLQLGDVSVRPDTGYTAGGSTTMKLTLGNASLGIFVGTGAPTISAGQGSIYLRRDGSSIATRLYVNTDGSTTWTNFVSAA